MGVGTGAGLEILLFSESPPVPIRMDINNIEIKTTAPIMKYLISTGNLLDLLFVFE